MIVINNRNDNGMYYKTMIIANLTTIIANLALARSINYDRKVHCKLKRTFAIVNYNPKPFIVQAAGLLWRRGTNGIVSICVVLPGEANPLLLQRPFLTQT
jgi:hypothetical protein